jgi:gamma-glutamyltranspeptidase/glutathione hydrolase
MVASTHWLASQTGMAVLERGGNAFDAAVATGFVLQVVEPHLNGPGGEVPAVFWSAARGEPLALCGQGVAPATATIERFHELGHELVPGTGVLAACVPGAFGGWLLLLRDFGTWRIGDVLEFAIGYAEHGYPLHERISATIELNEELIASWPGSRDLYLPAPKPGALFRNPALGAMYRRIVDESRGGSREDEIEKARLAHVGFVGGDRSLQRVRGRAAHGRRHGAWRERRAGRHARVSRADRMQDATVGVQPCRPATLARRGFDPTTATASSCM